MITLTLPCICIEPGCETWLQRAVKGYIGVEPHYAYMHPGVVAPKVTNA